MFSLFPSEGQIYLTYQQGDHDMMRIMKNVLVIFSIIVLSLSILLSFHGILTFPREKEAGVLTIDQKQPETPSPSPLALKPLSVNEIFSDDHAWVNTFPKDHIRTIIATGDVMVGRSINLQNVTTDNYTNPFLKVASFLKDADLTFINLETPLPDTCPLASSGMVFCGDQKNIQGLQYAGIDLANLANNHAGNHGAIGVDQTVAALLKAGIDAVGVNKPIIKDIHGIKFAFLGYDDITTPQPGINNVDEAKIKSDIALAKSEADVVIVQFHWGIEYTFMPSARQEMLGHEAIDDGADLVIGNHPHWIEPIEIYKGKLITYAHGNLVFDQYWSEVTREGIVGKYTFYDNKLIDVQYFPVYIGNYGQPYFLESTKKSAILTKMEQGSIQLASLNGEITK